MENLQKVIDDDLRMQDLAKMRVFIFQQKVQRNRYGPVVIIERNFTKAADKLLRVFDKKYPGVSEKDKELFFRNYSWRSRPLRPGMILDFNGI
jgi:carbamoylphosphate synthase large subunit